MNAIRHAIHALDPHSMNAMAASHLACFLTVFAAIRVARNAAVLTGMIVWPVMMMLICLTQHVLRNVPLIEASSTIDSITTKTRRKRNASRASFIAVSVLVRGILNARNAKSAII